MSPPRGYTLVELMVAMAILGTVAVLSAQLVIQSTRLMDSVARSSRNPDLTIATEWMRRDLYEARSVVGGRLGWTDEPLLMSGQDGGWIGLAAVDGQLVRTGAPPGVTSADSRVLLRGVVGWRWRMTGAGTIEIELRSFANPEAHHNLTGAVSLRLQRRVEALTVALRGQPGGRAW